MAKKHATPKNTTAAAHPDTPTVATPIPGEQRGAPRDPDLEPAPARTYRGVKVRAIRDGYYGDKLRRVGDVFVIEGTPHPKDPKRLQHFSDKWMERVDEGTPEKLSTNNDVIRRQHDEIVGGLATGDADVLGDDE